MKLTVLAVCLLQALAVPLQPEVAMELELVAQTTLAGRPYQSGPSYEWLPRVRSTSSSDGPCFFFVHSLFFCWGHHSHLLLPAFRAT